MSWKSISLNQTVSRANLQDAVNTGVFIAKNGVPTTNTNREVTKANALDYVYTWELNPSLNNKAPNQLPVKLNLAVQSNQVYAATNGASLYVGNNNRQWVYSIFENSGDEWASVSSSTDNRCILVGRSYTAGSGGGGAWVSNDYGETFTFLGAVMTNNDAATSTAMNTYGDYMVLTREVGSFGSNRSYIYWSPDSGTNWYQGFHDGTDYRFNGAAMSGNGVYATVLGISGTSYYVWTSNSFGSSYTKTFLCEGTHTFKSGCVGMSKSGQYQLLTPPVPTNLRGYFYVSNDWGLNWTAITVTPIPLTPNDQFIGCSVSAGGDYMTVAAYSVTLGQYRTYISSDWGVNWAVVSSGYTGEAQAVDSSGQYQYQDRRKSIDYGNTWNPTNIYANSISVNSTTLSTPYIYGTTPGGTLYRSATQGNSFTLLSISGYFTKVATSGGANNGKYVAAIKDNDPGGFPNYNLYQSSDYGATWSTVLSFGGQILSSCAVSDDGVYWLAAAYDGPSNTSYIYRSSTSGAIWDYVYSYFGNPVSCDMSGSGQYSTIVFYSANGNYSAILRSNDYGANWIQPSSPLLGQLQNKEVTSVCISYNGKYRMLTTRVGNAQGRLFYSSNYGTSFVERFYDDDYGMDFCVMDNSGVVCMAGGDGISTFKVYYTIQRWNGFDVWPILPSGTALGGLNISNDATYWTIAVNSGIGGPNCYSYTSTDAGNTWTQNTLTSVVTNLKMLSK